MVTPRQFVRRNSLTAMPGVDIGERRAVMTSPGDAVDEQVAAAVRADVAQRHRGEGLLLSLDDHDRPQSSSASRVTAGRRCRILLYRQAIPSAVMAITGLAVFGLLLHRAESLAAQPPVMDTEETSTQDKLENTHNASTARAVDLFRKREA